VRRLGYATAEWKRYLARLPRAAAPDPRVARRVSRIVAEVRRDGDRGLVRLTERLDGVRLRGSELFARPEALRALARRAEPPLVAALRDMARRIEAFHRRQIQRGFRLRLPDGTLLEELVRPLDSAGLYVPGGAGAYPSSVLMNAIPARLARVPRIVVATPPRGLEENPALAAALVIGGVEGTVLRVGGAQAVAALAYGTESVAPVAKILGPGNAYVAEAKRQVRGACEIDREAGPSEVVVLADDTADAGYLAVDLLAQAEHGSGDETAVLVTPSRRLADAVERLLADALPSAANAAATRRALARNSAVVLVRDVREGVAAVNALAPEHAAVVVRGAASVARGIVAGAVFVGAHTPVAAGDYGVGPSHVLPTGGAARFASPLGVRDFVRRQSRVRMTAAGLARVARGMARVAAAEGFPAHALSLLTRVAPAGRHRSRGGFERTTLPSPSVGRARVGGR
jgi:histidinol dehydrogenase